MQQVADRAREQLRGRLARLEIQSLLVLLGEHQPRLQLEQRRDQDQELGGGLEVQLAGALEVLDIGQHDLREVDLEQVDLLLEHERQEQVEGTVKDLEIEVERRKRHRRDRLEVAPDVNLVATPANDGQRGRAPGWPSLRV